MFAEWNSVHLCLYNGLSRNAQRCVFVDCAALRFIISDFSNRPRKATGRYGFRKFITCHGFVYFVYLGFYVAFNTVQVISRLVVGRAEETSTYSSLGFCTVNCRPTASNYQLSHSLAAEVGGEP